MRILMLANAKYTKDLLMIASPVILKIAGDLYLRQDLRLWAVTCKLKDETSKSNQLIERLYRDRPPFEVKLLAGFWPDPDFVISCNM